MQPCPRKPQTGEKDSYWRPDGTCSYCGSMSALEFFTAITSGAELTPTDKNYKVYVETPDPEAGIPWIYSMANHQPDDSGQWIFVTESNVGTMPRSSFKDLLGSWVKIGTKNKNKTGKFYFYHLTEEEMIRFIHLHNDKKLKLAYPGHFFVFPFFMHRVKARADI